MAINLVCYYASLTYISLINHKNSPVSNEKYMGVSGPSLDSTEVLVLW